MTLSVRRPELSVVIPCFNESGNVEALTQELTAALSGLARARHRVGLTRHAGGASPSTAGGTATPTVTSSPAAHGTRPGPRLCTRAPFGNSRSTR